MSDYSHENPPAGDSFATQPLDPVEWLGPENTRSLIRSERTVLLEEVRTHLVRLEPLLKSQLGVCFFKSYTDEGELETLVCNSPAVAGENNTAIVSNLTTEPEAGDPHYPDGKSRILNDSIVPNNSRWLFASWEHLYRHHHGTWPRPEWATLLVRRHDRLDLYGNMCNSDLTPRPAGDLEGVASFSEQYLTIIAALRQCHKTTLEDDIRQIELLT